jgi:hypothetical protein
MTCRRISVRSEALALAVVLALAGRVGAAEEPARNQCIACHQGDVMPIALGHSFQEWQVSAHGKEGVGCEKCHGGDPHATTAEVAHRSVLPASDPASPIHATRLPATCGACHSKEFAAYAETVHARKLAAQGGKGATCLTCHGAMAISYPSPSELAARCAVCHQKPTKVQAALAVLSTASIQLWRTRHTLDASARSEAPWHKEGQARLEGLERAYRDIQLKWHTFAMDQVLQQSHDLIKLAKALDEEAGIKEHRPGP